MSATLQEKILGKLWIKVIKKQTDDRNSLCGEPVIKDPDGGPDIFYVPAHQADYFPFVHPNYTFSEDYVTDSEHKLILEELKNRKPTSKPEIPQEEIDRLIDERLKLMLTCEICGQVAETDQGKKMHIYSHTKRGIKTKDDYIQWLETQKPQIPEDLKNATKQEKG